MKPCFLYCRKSSEDASRQVQSIGDQKKIMREIAQSRDLEISEIFIDEKSAGEPYQRPAFQEMMKRIHTGEASVILSWKFDRLSRNPIETGQLSWILQQGIISEIIVSDRNYLPQDNVLLLTMEGAMANQYLRDLSTNVKRGMQSKVERGIFPGKPPLGYLNSGQQKAYKCIVPDQHNFTLVKKLWELLLTGNYQLADIYRIMQEKYPLLNKGKIVTFSTFHRIFHNRFYCGIFKWNGKDHLGVHEKMITQSEFDTVQAFLNKKEKTRERDLEFDFKGFFKCGTCQAQITAERKTKFIIKTQQEKSFDYYRCVHRKRDIECREKPLSKHQIMEQLQKELNNYVISEKVIDFGITQLERTRGKETQLQAVNLANLNRKIQTLKLRKEQVEDNLVVEADHDIRQLMKLKYEGLKIQIQKHRENYTTLQAQIENNNQKIIQTLQLIKKVKYVLKSGTVEQKKTVLQHIGTNWKIKDRKLDYKPYFVPKAIAKTKEFIRSKNSVSEPSLRYLNTDKNLSSEQVRFVWLTLWEFIRNSKG